MNPIENSAPTQLNFDCAAKLKTLEKKITKIAGRMSELKAENEALKAELLFHEKNTGKTKVASYENEEFLRQKKKVRDMLENLIEKYAKAGI